MKDLMAAHDADEPLHVETITGRAERVDPGNTNTVLETEDRVVKLFHRYPAASFTFFLVDLLRGRFKYQDRRTRMNNQQEVSKLVAEAGCHIPDLFYRGDIGMAFEKVRGTNLKQYLLLTTSAEAERIGRQLGRIMDRLQARHVCLRDFRLSNFLITPAGELYSIDHEYATDRSEPFDRSYDKILLIATARHLDNTTYRRFRAGFEQGYGRPIWLGEELCALIISIYQADNRLNRIRNAVYNLFSDIIPGW